MSAPGIESIVCTRTGCTAQSHEHVTRAERFRLTVFVQVRQRPRHSEPLSRRGVGRNTRRQSCFDPLLPDGWKGGNGSNRRDQKGERDEFQGTEIIRWRFVFSRLAGPLGGTESSHGRDYGGLDGRMTA